MREYLNSILGVIELWVGLKQSNWLQIIVEIDFSLDYWHCLFFIF